MTELRSERRARALMTIVALTILSCAAVDPSAQQNNPSTQQTPSPTPPPTPPPQQRQPIATRGAPSSVVREFYRALRERRFREAFAMSIYRPAVDTLSAEEYEELRPDFERTASAVPPQIEISGEQITNDTATVFGRFSIPDPNNPTPTAATPEQVTLIRAGGVWIIGNQADAEVVRRAGKDFFFQARIEAHHDDVRNMLRRIVGAELIYSTQHNGQFADLPTLVSAGLLPPDIQTSDSTGYRFRITLGADARSFSVAAEPVRYNRTGKLSFYADQSGMQERDMGGRPLRP